MKGKIKFSVSYVGFDRRCGNQAKDPAYLPTWSAGGEAGPGGSVQELPAYRCV